MWGSSWGIGGFEDRGTDGMGGDVLTVLFEESWGEFAPGVGRWLCEEGWRCGGEASRTEGQVVWVVMYSL